MLEAIALRQARAHAARGTLVVEPIDGTAERSVRDVVGAGRVRDVRGDDGTTRMQLELRRYDHDAGPVLVGAVSCESVANERWWEAESFGLRADDAVVVELELPGFVRGVACHLTSEWWTEPTFVTSPGEIPASTQFLLWRRNDGAWGVVLPVAAGDTTSLLAGSGDVVEVRASTGQDRRLAMAAPLFVAATGSDPWALVDRVYAAAARLLGRSAKLRRDKRYPACFEGFGWCTWDAFYRDVTAAGIRQQLEHFEKIGLPLGFLLVDDGWYPMRDNQLLDVRTDAARFPDGLGALVDEARTRFGVRHVGVWHAMTGYWCGIHRDHTLTPELAADVDEARGGALAPSSDLGRAFTFFDAWHRQLAAEGVDFVKVDGQGAVHRFTRGHVPLAAGARAMSRALQASAGVNFEGQMLNCMSMRHELMWSWPMSNVTRSSNDYMIAGKEMDPGRHAQTNAANAVYLGQLSYCDFDMFRSDHEHAPFHRALRALSGGPIYISDPPGVTRVEVLMPLMLSTGQILRCDEVALPTEDCLLVDARRDRVPLKIMNRAGDAGLLGVFHVSEGDDPVSGSASPADVAGLQGDRFAVWEHGAHRGTCLGRADRWPVTVARAEARVYVVAPVRGGDGEGFAPIGLADKLVAPKTIRGWRRRGNVARVLLAEAGTFVAYAEQTVRAVTVDGVAIAFVQEEGFVRAQIPAGDRGAPEVTVELAPRSA